MIPNSTPIGTTVYAGSYEQIDIGVIVGRTKDDGWRVSLAGSKSTATFQYGTEYLFLDPLDAIGWITYGLFREARLAAKKADAWLRVVETGGFPPNTKLPFRPKLDKGKKAIPVSKKIRRLMVSSKAPQAFSPEALRALLPVDNTG